MINNRDRVYDKAEEMAAKYREKMRAQQETANPQAQTEPESELPEIEEIDIVPAVED
jgi:small subunit ribosomal protein S1